MVEDLITNISSRRPWTTPRKPPLISRSRGTGEQRRFCTCLDHKGGGDDARHEQGQNPIITPYSRGNG